MKALRSPVRRLLTSPGAIDLRERWLFAAGSRAVLIAEHRSGVIIEANPAAATLLTLRTGDLIGAPLAVVFAESSRAALMRCLATTHACGYGKPVRLRTRRGNGQLAVTLSFMRAGPDAYLLVRLARPAFAVRQQANDAVSSVVLDSIEETPEGFVLTDLGLRVTYANPAFASLAGVAAIDDLIGRSLAQWLELSQIDLIRLRDQMALRQAVEIWTTVLRRPSQLLTPVEITAVAVPDGEDAGWGFRVAARHAISLAAAGRSNRF